MHKVIDPEFKTNTKPVLAIVAEKNATYLICRGSAAVAEIRDHLQNVAATGVASSEALRVIPDAIKTAFQVSADHVIKLPEVDMRYAVIALSQDASGKKADRLISGALQKEALSLVSIPPMSL